MFVSVKPVPKPRLTQRDRWAHRPAVVRYHAFCDELRIKFTQRYLPPTLLLTFYIEMPKSWSKKKRVEHNGKPHQQRPDVDNLVKAVMDALCEDDSYIYAVHAQKYWSLTPGIDIDEIPVI